MDRTLGRDILATLAAVSLVTVAVLTGVDGPIRAVIGGLLVLFIPGYAASTLLFPATADPETGSPASQPLPAGLPFIERMAFSVGVSVATVPVLAWLVAGLGYQYSVWTTAGAVGLLSLVLVVLGGIRRRRTPAPDRYVVTGETVRSIVERMSQGPPVRRGSTVALVIAVIFTASVVMVGLVAPPEHAGFTQVSVLVEGNDGLQLAGGSVESGASTQLVFRLENHENEQVQYTVFVERQRIVGGDVVDRVSADRFSKSVQPGTSWQHPHEIRSPTDGTVRITYLVYRGDPPGDPSSETAYRTATVRVTPPGVGPGSQGDGG